ncbi:MAG: LysR family transcriptional regulator [Burkholderiales bacterium]|nr:LysR family transcriptional regulator [Burkholderiales bacterium]
MDMRLLSVFDEVYKTRSVTRAAENLNIPQTSVSFALARMRRQFNDPLFVRTPEGMIPTPHAEQLLGPLRQAYELLQAATQEQVVFDPAISTRHFRISMTDVSHLEFLPGLMRRAEVVAPSVHIEVLRITPDTAQRLAAGDADLAVGYMPELEAGFYQQQLLEQGFACVLRRDHPRINQRMTATMFKRERHVVVTTPGTGNELLERQLRKLGIERRVALSLQMLPGLGNLLAQTDLVATVPERVAQTLVRIAAVKLLQPPFETPVFAIKQHWHERFQQDPANRWLRSLIADLFKE